MGRKKAARAAAHSAAPSRAAPRGTIAAALAASLLAASAPAAYLHESRPKGMLWLSDPSLKRAFVVQEPVSMTILGPYEASQIVNLPPAAGLFEQPNGPKIPEGRCLGDDAKIRDCERQWESTNLARGKGVVSRNASTLTLAPKTGAKLVLADWQSCSREGECDGERFLYLGALGRSAYQAVEIEYEHDSPSLVLFDPNDGRLVAVHYGSEATFLNPAETLLVSAEDMNDATTLLVTRLGAGGPAIDLQCLGARTESSSFGVAFKRWSSDSSFEVVLIKAGQNLAGRFERSAKGTWTLRGQADLKSQGFECRQRGAAPGAAPPAKP
ncbi:MAG: hypothetical protein ABW298_12840 [Candidatus Binatia bacterium]